MLGGRICHDALANSANSSYTVVRYSQAQQFLCSVVRHYRAGRKTGKTLLVPAPTLSIAPKILSLATEGDCVQPNDAYQPEFSGVRGASSLYRPPLLLHLDFSPRVCRVTRNARRNHEKYVLWPRSLKSKDSPARLRARSIPHQFTSPYLRCRLRREMHHWVFFRST